PSFVDGPTYASMLNESRVTRGLEPLYNEKDMYLFRSGMDPDLYPNVNWMDALLKDGAMTHRANVDISGGGATARYFVSMSYLNEDGMYKVDNSIRDKYDSNPNYQRWNYRMNVDVDVTKTTLLKVGISGWLSKQNEPGCGGGESQLWASIVGHNPISTPIYYSDGKLGSSGTGNKANPWMLSTQNGYKEKWNNTIQTNITLEQDLKFITKGLKFTGRFGFDTFNENTKLHEQWPELWKAERERDSNGNMVFHKLSDEQVMKHSSSAKGTRKEFFEAILNYSRTFGDHRVGGTLKYTQDANTNTQSVSDYEWLDRKHQGLAGRFTYGWKYRYFFDFNFGYNGSENFAPGRQFGFFPAYSLAWNIAEESFVRKNLPWLSMLKLRYSYGKVGSDNVGRRFPYLPGFSNLNDFSYTWGDYVDTAWAGGNNSNKYNALTYSMITSEEITWEIATKHDVGLDISILNDKISGTIDYFHETRDGIFMNRANLPWIVGMNGLKANANVGKVLSKGIDGNIAYHDKFGKVDFTVRGNFTYSKNEILEYDEVNSLYPYKLKTGQRVGQKLGLIAVGLFKDYEDIRNSPDQSPIGGSSIMPGDIKYKDVNADGRIGESDIVPIGATTRPNLIYGFGASAQWKGLDVNVHFQGAGKSSFFISGQSVYAFSEGEWGNVFDDYIGNYWSLDNPNPNAKYPRLSWNGNSNNNRPSTFWLRDGSYLRLKTLEVGYTLPKNISRVLYMNNIRIFFIGTNLLTFSSFKMWDPEMGSSTGQQYPLSKSYTLGLTVTL
ncbi:SusC/RagA family TonB-linked outer membrane protein, partial [Bacteroides caccae]